MMAGRYNY